MLKYLNLKMRQIVYSLFLNKINPDCDARNLLNYPNFLESIFYALVIFFYIEQLYQFNFFKTFIQIFLLCLVI